MLALALFLVVVAIALLLWGNHQKAHSGIPKGKVITLDLHEGEALQSPLFSKRYHLTGRPDFLIRKGREWIPVEIKTADAPHSPYEGHMFQLFAYCLLVEENYGIRPPYGVLHYRGRVPEGGNSAIYQIEYTPQMREKLIKLLDQMHRAEQSGSVGRSHDEIARCRGCGYAAVCDQRLSRERLP
ncbi:MAG: CRISPR-associated protein Cas4 [Anaerolineales bacterium]